jgi:3-hydroxyacyl-[acyl-carrier-protein] dehydratase
MLKDHFYHIESFTYDSPEILNASIRLNPGHHIFAGHFPGQPVVPGVCMMAIVKELLEEKLSKTIKLQSASNMKFLSLIDPLRNEQVNVKIHIQPLNDTTIQADASFFFEEITFFKLIKAKYELI